MSGREAFLVHRSRRVTDCGALGRENVGLSNRIAGESPAHRKSKVSLAMVFNQGLGGPKVNPKGVADGQSINISTLLYFFNKVRNLVSEATYWIVVGNLTQEELTGTPTLRRGKNLFTDEILRPEPALSTFASLNVNSANVDSDVVLNKVKE